MTTQYPSSRRNLDMAIHRIAESEAGYVRMRTMLANVIVSQMMPSGVIKGGSALKLRFGDKGTRATTDLDAERMGDLEDFMEAFSDALIEGWNGFTGRVSPLIPAHPKNVPTQYVMRPFDVNLNYLGRPWCTVPFKLGHDEIDDASDPEYVMPPEAKTILNGLGFPDPQPIPLMPLHYQIAQKLHGASEPNSKRAHDLIDLQVIATKSTIDLSLVRKTCERLFSYRKIQPWPSLIVKGENWDALYERQVLPDLVFPSVDEAIIWTNDLLEKISKA